MTSLRHQLVTWLVLKACLHNRVVVAVVVIVVLCGGDGVCGGVLGYVCFVLALS